MNKWFDNACLKDYYQSRFVVIGSYGPFLVSVTHPMGPDDLAPPKTFWCEEPDMAIPATTPVKLSEICHDVQMFSSKKEFYRRMVQKGITLNGEPLTQDSLIDPRTIGRYIVRSGKRYLKILVAP